MDCECGNKPTLKGVLEQYGQGHILSFYHEMTEEEREDFLNQLKGIDFTTVFRCYQQIIMDMGIQREMNETIEPVSVRDFGSSLSDNPLTLDTYRDEGLEAIAEGRVAALVLAGGQGTRLGTQLSKGMIPIGLPSGKTIFQIHAERIRRVCELAEDLTRGKAVIPLYVLTSDATDTQIRNYFNKENYFKLAKNDVIFFKQGSLPCLTMDGKLILSGKHTIAMAPNGTGGVFGAMAKNGIFDDMHKRGVEYVHIYPIDNVMIKVADPTFVGYCLSTKTDCAAAVVKKFDAMQNLGTVCKVGGDHYEVIEYTELSTDMKKKTNENGEILFESGSVCNHMFQLDFMRKILRKRFKPHGAKKKVAYVDVYGNEHKPTEPNALKIERFVFESFRFASNFVTWEVGYEEFSPIKNANSEKIECPMTARADLLALHKRYIAKAGAFVPPEDFDVEISPLVSYAGEELEDRLIDMRIVPYSTTHIESEEELQNRSTETFQVFSKYFANES